MQDILAIIPARGGSKGIPRKNIALLGGKPLIAYTIEAALRARNVSRIVVSTEDEEIAEVARSVGAEVPFLRPSELAGDHSDLGDALQYTLDRLLNEEMYAPCAVLQLYVTSPFRTVGLVESLASRLQAGHQSVQTVRRIPLESQLFFLQDSGEALRFCTGQGAHCFRPYGNASGFRLRSATRGSHIHYLDDPAMCIDIDTPADLRLAEAWLASGGRFLEGR